MKQKLFNITVYSMLAYSIVNAVYVALPPEYQALIPQYNELLALVTGGSTLLLGSGGLAVQTYIQRAKIEASGRFNLLADHYVKLADKYDLVDKKYRELVIKSDKIVGELGRINNLLKIELQSKLTNPMIDEGVKKLIEGAIEDDK